MINGQETYLGVASSPEECLTLAKDLSPTVTGATFTNSDGPGGCWAEFGKTLDPNPNYKTCPFFDGTRYDNCLSKTMYELIYYSTKIQRTF